MNVIANDSDPEGNVPLAVLSVSNSNPSRGTPRVIDASTVGYDGAAVGSDIVTYTVRDSLGAAATGILNVTIRTSALCNASPAPALTPASSGG